MKMVYLVKVVHLGISSDCHWRITSCRIFRRVLRH